MSSHKKYNNKPQMVLQNKKREERSKQKREESAKLLAELQEKLKYISNNQEYQYNVNIISEIDSIIQQYQYIKTKIEEANIFFEERVAKFNDLISDSDFFEKSFDMMCLYQNPLDSEDSANWFSSLKRALRMMDLAIDDKIDETIGRVPPKSFRACIKQSSVTEMINTLSTNTPVFRVKEQNTVECKPLLQEVASMLYSSSKWLLNVEQKLKGTLLKSMPQSDISKSVKEILTYRDTHDIVNSIERILYPFTGTIVSKEDVDKCLRHANECVNELPEWNRQLYEYKVNLSAYVEKLTKQLYHSSVVDLFKLLNAIYRLLEAAGKSVHDAENETLIKIRKFLVNLKSIIVDFLISLDIYENEEVIENKTIWNDEMEHIDVLEGEEDSSKPLGMISKVSSYGFYHRLNDETKVYIEKTKVFIYRH